MKFGTSLIIALLAVVALAAELVLYFVMGVGTALTGGGASALGATAFVFMGLMILTAATGILAPLCALAELVTKWHNLGAYLLAILLLLIGGGLIIRGATMTSEFTRRSADLASTSATEADGPVARDAKLEAARIQIEQFGLALEAFRLDLGRYPTTKEGLGALVRRPAGLDRWDGPYLKKAIPNDPWGRLYIYTDTERDGRPYSLFSLGAEDAKSAERLRALSEGNTAPTQDGWVARTETSPVDDRQNVFLSRTAESEITGWLGKKHRPTLMIRCKENRTEMFVTTGMAASVEYRDQHTVTIRYDKEPAFEVRMGDSTDKEALFFGDAIPQIKRMMGQQEMLFRFTPFNASPAMTTFKVAGLEEAIKPLRTACGW